MSQQPVTMQLFWEKAATMLQAVLDTQADAIHKAAQICAECIERDGILHTYGSGHSRGFAMEMVHRAGGLAPVNRIDIEDLALYARWPLELVRSLEAERSLEVGKELLSCYSIGSEDIFLIASQSGVNVAIVECALQIKKRGNSLIVITSLEHSQRTPSRHPIGKKLHELADIIIDNGTAFGDTLLDLPSGEQVSSASTLIGVLLAQALTSEIAGLLLEKGIQPPVFNSDNIQGGIERNKTLHQRYENRVHWH